MNTGYFALTLLGILTPILFSGSKDVHKEEKIANILVFIVVLGLVLFRASRGGD